MVTSVQTTSGSYASASADSANVTATQDGTSAQAQAAPARPAQDTVKLSTTAQVVAMKSSGATVSQISANLGISVDEVDSALGITSSSSSSSSEASILAALSAKR